LDKLFAGAPGCLVTPLFVGGPVCLISQGRFEEPVRPEWNVSPNKRSLERSCRIVQYTVINAGQSGCDRAEKMGAYLAMPPPSPLA